MQRIDVQKSDEMPSEKTRTQLCANFIREIVLKFTKKLTHTHTQTSNRHARIFIWNTFKHDMVAVNDFVIQLASWCYFRLVPFCCHKFNMNRLRQPLLVCTVHSIRIINENSFQKRLSFFFIAARLGVCVCASSISICLSFIIAGIRRTQLHTGIY